MVKCHLPVLAYNHMMHGMTGSMFSRVEGPRVAEIALARQTLDEGVEASGTAVPVRVTVLPIATAIFTSETLRSPLNHGNMNP